MNRGNFLDLIEASQTTLKQELLTRHPESKYQLLMLSRSFDLLKQYLIQQEQYEASSIFALQDALHSPVKQIDEGLDVLSQQLRQHYQPELLDALQRLNRADLSITHPKVIKHG